MSPDVNVSVLLLTFRCGCGLLAVAQRREEADTDGRLCSSFSVNYEELFY